MSEKITFEDVKSERCAYCIHNPNATEPYNKMKHVELDDLTLEFLDALTQQAGLNRNCIMCASVRTLVNMPIEDVLKILKAAKNE